MKWLKDNLVAVISFLASVVVFYTGRETDRATINMRMGTVEKSQVEMSSSIVNLTERAIISIEDRRNIHSMIDAATLNNNDRFNKIEIKLDKIADAVGAKK